MAKKQVGVTLRKPPPASADAFVNAETPAAPAVSANVPVSAVTPAPASVVVAKISEPAVHAVRAPEPPEPAKAHVAESEPEVVLPPPPLRPSAIRELAPRTEKTVTSPAGHSLRELTVFLPPELAQRLALHCMEKDRDVNKVLAELVEKHLGDRARAGRPDLTTLDRLKRAVFALLERRLAWT